MQGNTAVGRPLLEIYWLQNTPGPMWSGGIWVRTLRDIFQALAQVGAQNPSVVTNPAATITTNCFMGSSINSPFGKKVYQENASKFTEGTTYKLGAYYNAPAGAQTVNCTDQAGFLQVCLGAVGIPSSELHLQPFGFVNNTHVVGNPTLLCNSPDWYVYGNTAAALVPAGQEPPEAPNTDDIPPKVPNYPRIWWQDHWVVLQCAYPPPEGVAEVAVLDATLGPYVVAGLMSYIAAAIDNSAAAQGLYKYWTASPPPPLPTQWTSYKPTPPLTSATLLGPNTGQSSQYTTSPGFTSVQVNQS